MTQSAAMSRAQPCPSTTIPTNPAKPPQSVQRRLQANVRLCHLAQSLFGSQGIQDLAIVGVLFGNNIQQIGRFQIQCNGTMAQGLFSIHELVNSRVLAVTGRSKKGRQAARRRRQQMKRLQSSPSSPSSTDQDMPPSLSPTENNHHRSQQQQRPILTPTLLAELFPLVVYRTIRKHTRRDRVRLGGHGAFSPPPLMIGGRSSRPPSFTPGASPSLTQTTVTTTNSSTSSTTIASQEPWSFGSLTPLDRFPREHSHGDNASLSGDSVSPPSDDELKVSMPDVLRRLFQRCLFHVPDLPLPDELCFLAAASFPLPQALRALHVAWTIEFLKHRVCTERRSRQQERRLAAISGSHPPHLYNRRPSVSLFQPSPEMNTVVEEEAGEEEGEESGFSASSTTDSLVAASPLMTHRPSCLGGLEFRSEMYAYKMRLARAARARSIKLATNNGTHPQTATTMCSSATDDAETASLSSMGSTSPAPSTPVEAVEATNNNSSSTPLSPIGLLLQHDRERPDKRLMQQLLSLENKIPRIVRKWAHHARHFFAEELMREDSLAQKWVDQQRIEVVLGTGCQGSQHLVSTTSSSPFSMPMIIPLQQQPSLPQQPSPSTFVTSAMHPSSSTSYTPSSAAASTLAQQCNANHSHSMQQHLQYANAFSQQQSTHAPSAAYMQQQEQEQQHSIVNANNTHPTAMMTTTTSMTTMPTTTHSPRLITGGTTPVTTTPPRTATFAEGIRLSRQGSSQGYHYHRRSVDLGSCSMQASSNSAPTTAVNRSNLRNSFQNLAPTTTSPHFHNHHHRVSTSQQMLSLHLWLSCLVSPISPDQMVHERLF